MHLASKRPIVHLKTTLGLHGVILEGVLPSCMRLDVVLSRLEISVFPYLDMVFIPRLGCGAMHDD